VVVPDPLAPVVTVEENYLVGANEAPDDFPGMAHALEHMAFRGCAGLSADQIAAIYAQLGGSDNADTQQHVTQYFATVPAQDLEVALRLDAACMRDIAASPSEWAQEKGAIEQEVARDHSEATYKLMMRLNADLFRGTPYAHDALGTRASFERTSAPMLKSFAGTWYTPNNAVLVISGDVQAAATIDLVRRIYGSIPSRSLPRRFAVVLKSVKAETFSIDSNLPYTMIAVAYRLPGTDDADAAAVRVLADALASQRAPLYDLVTTGAALDAGFELPETYRRASVGLAVASLPAGADPTSALERVRQTLAEAGRGGVSPDLVEAAKRRAVAAAAFERNSIAGLAALWSETVAAEGRTSPNEDVAAIERVTTADVKRVAREYLGPDRAIVATLVPRAAGEPTESKTAGPQETLTSPPTKPVTLPSWAASALGELRVPRLPSGWTDIRLANGIRLITKPDHTSPTVTLVGSIRHEPALQTPKGEEGVDSVLADLFAYGTTHRGRVAFLTALDDIAASESAGYDFSLSVLAPQFSRGVELLADHLLHPALPQDAFRIVRRQTEAFVAGRERSPDYRADRALTLHLLPAHDPDRREPTAESVRSLTLDDVQAFYARTFRPDLTTIVVIGAIDPHEAQAAIERWFGDWTASGPAPDVTLAPVPVNMAADVSVVDPTIVQASVSLAEEVALNRFDPDYYALQLANHVLGGGFYATRLYHDLRQETGLVYTVQNDLTATRTRSVYAVRFACDPSSVDRATALIQRDLQAMQTADVTDQELDQAKALLLRRIPLSESSESAVADGLVARAQLGLPLNEPERAASRYLALSAADLRAAFARWIRPAGFVRVVQRPSR
jgi:zinc protease